MPISHPMPEDLRLTKIVAACLHDLELKGDAALQEYCQEYPSFAAKLKQAVELVSDLNDLTTVDSSPDKPFADRYELGELLGVGGMGRVYRARDRNLDREVALKQVRPEIATVEEIRKRFEREVRAATRIEHPNLCRVYDGDIWEGVPYMVMELIEGETLHTRIQAAKHKPEELVLYVEKVATALHAVHEQEMLHRDVKPANIMIRTDGEPALLDFGLARDVHASDGLTKEGSEPGTWCYMSPEQLAPRGRELDRRTDVYSIGLVLYECLTGKRAFDGGSELELKTRILKEMPTSVRKFTPRVASDLAVVVEKAIAKNRDDRYATAEALAEDLRRIREHKPIEAQRSGPALRTWRWSQRNPMLAALLVVLTAGVTTSTWLYWEAKTQIAANAMQDAKLNMESGNWRAALTAFQNAEQAGYHDATEIAIGRIEAWERSDQLAEASAELTRIGTGEDLGQYRAKVLLLGADINVNRLLRPNEKIGDIKLARSLHQLDESDDLFAQAMLATSVDDAIRHLRKAVAIDPSNRRVVELLGNLAVLSGRRDLAHDVLVMRRSLYVNDPTHVIYEAFVAGLEGDESETNAVLSRADSATREMLESWVPFMQATAQLIQEFDQLEQDMLLEPDAEFAGPFFKKYAKFGVRAIAMLQQSRKAGFGTMFRITPGVAQAIRGLGTTIGVSILFWSPERYALGLRKTGESIGDGMFFYAAGTTYMYGQKYDQAETCFLDALKRKSSVVSRSTIMLYLLENRWRRTKYDPDPKRREAGIVPAIDTIYSILEDPELDARTFRHLYNLSKNLGAPHQASEIALRWRRTFRGDEHALEAVGQVKAWLRKTKPPAKKRK